MQAFRDIKNYLRDFANLFFPNLCAACSKQLVKGEELLCTDCLYFLPRTGFHNQADNKTAQLFYGQAEIKNAASFYFFNKGSKYRQLIHALKYQNNKQLGVGLGRIYGGELRGSEFAEADLIIPVPLHPLKQRKRGYNQSAQIVYGLSESLEIPANTTNLRRTVNTDTQTRKTLEERRDNVESVFQVKNSAKFQGKHILIVDDVVTTGSTLTACAQTVLEIPDTEVSVLTLAIAGD